MVSFRSESEILFEKSCDIRASDIAQFYIDVLGTSELLSVANSLKIQEVKARSEFLSTIDFKKPVKRLNTEYSGYLQERFIKLKNNFSNRIFLEIRSKIHVAKPHAQMSIVDGYDDYEDMYDADLDSGKKEFKDWEYNSGETAATVSIWATRC